MLIRIDPNSQEALFDQVAGSVRQAIGAGELGPGDRLPPARDVAASLDINIHTVLRAYQELRDQGLVDMRRGRGAVVSLQASALGALTADIVALGEKAALLGMDSVALAALVKDTLRNRET